MLLVTAPTASATMPGQNGRIAFVRAGNIYTAAANGTALRRLTTGGGFGVPKWSADGRRIAYQKAGYVWTMNADGTHKVRHWPGSAASWSPDGRRLAYLTPSIETICGDSPAVVVRALAGGPATILAFDDFACSGNALSSVNYDGRTTSWSADGHRVLYSYTIPGGDSFPGSTSIDEFDLTAPYPTDGWPPPGVRTVVAWNDAHTPQVDYAPRRSNVVFATNARTGVGINDGRNRLYVFSRDGSYRRQVGRDAYVSFPVHSPDNRYVLYTQHRPGSAPVIRRMRLPGTAAPVTVLTNAAQADWQPVR